MLKRLRALCPWIEPTDLPLARRWCELEVLASRCYGALRLDGPTNTDGDSRRLLDDYRKLVMAQTVLARELGLSPSARMALKANGTKAALDVVSAMSSSSESAETPEVEPNGGGGRDDGNAEGGREGGGSDA